MQMQPPDKMTMLQWKIPTSQVYGRCLQAWSRGGLFDAFSFFVLEHLGVEVLHGESGSCDDAVEFRMKDRNSSNNGLGGWLLGVFHRDIVILSGSCVRIIDSAFVSTKFKVENQSAVRSVILMEARGSSWGDVRIEQTTHVWIGTRW